VPNENPTNPDPKFVASEAERSVALRGLLAAALKFLRRRVPLRPTGNGDLSTWVLTLHGLVRDDESAGSYKEQPYDETDFTSLIGWMAKTFGPSLNPKTLHQIDTKSKAIGAATTRHIKTTSRDITNELDTVLPQTSVELLTAWGLPADFPLPYSVSVANVRQMLRAFQAVAACIAINRAHPVTLIARAFKGGRKAVLDLVKVDTLFLHDACTESVIKNAEMRNDQRFLDQLVRAQGYKFQPTIRDLHHLYFQLVFMIDQFGFPLPALGELSRIIDRHGREYPTLESFERDFQRQRNVFKQMIEDANQELHLNDGFAPGS
jgi:hypothetical protein